MIRFLLLLFFMCISVSIAHAKVIVVGSHGGPSGYANFTLGDEYEPISVHDGKTSDWLGDPNNVSEGEDYTAHGVDASIVYLWEKVQNLTYVFAMISRDTANPLTAYYYVANNYNQGDIIFIVGYSSGGSYAVKLAQMLSLNGYPIRALGLIDAILNSSTDVYIPSLVEKVAVYHQESDVMDMQGFNSFIFDSDDTSYYSGHPNLITGDGIHHFSIVWKESVWKDFGQKMVEEVGDGSITFTEGDHTHIIHDDYRCSNDQCWEPGGETNCWDAHTWYEINGGDITDVVRNRDRNMCAEVYDSGESEEPTYVPPEVTVIDPGTSGGGDSDPDLHISRFHIRLYKSGDDYDHDIYLTMEYGSTTYIEGELKVRNKSSREALDVDSDYRIENNRDFDKNDIKVDEDNPFDIDPYDKETKNMKRIAVTVSGDGKTLTVSGDKSRTFPIVDGHVKFYIFADVEEKGRDDGDHDISSEHDKDEYGKVDIEVVKPNYLPKGFIDTVNCTEIRGWTKDQNTSDPLSVHLYIADTLGNNKVFYDSFVADLWRSDVGEHGFVWDYPEELKDGKARRLYFYAINKPQGSNPQIGETQIACANRTESLRPAYRFYNTGMRSHFYTISEREKNKLLSTGWRIEGVEFNAHHKQEQGSKPVYRFYRPGKGHFFTISLSEKNKVMGYSDWRYEGIAFYAYSWDHPGTKRVYRLYSSNNQSHFFTTSWSEVQSAVGGGYKYEGIGFRAYPK